MRTGSSSNDLTEVVRLIEKDPRGRSNRAKQLATLILRHKSIEIDLLAKGVFLFLYKLSILRPSVMVPYLGFIMLLT